MERLSTDRRDFMKAAGVLAITTAASSLGMRDASAQQVPYSAGTEAPKLKAPANACDCHMHIYDAKYPTAPSATLKPPDALVADYKLLQKRIGTTRNVVVTTNELKAGKKLPLMVDTPQAGAASTGSVPRLDGSGGRISGLSTCSFHSISRPRIRSPCFRSATSTRR